MIAHQPMPGTAGPRTPVFAALAAAAVLAAASPTAAVDGVIEIHPACVAAGCFPGDGPGFPVEIAQPGSYRLTGSLHVPDENTTAVLLQSGDVSIDLNGFAIQGVTSCTRLGGILSCSPVGTGVGIANTNSLHQSFTVRNGTVRGMGRHGISFAGPAGVVEAVTAESNGGTGVLFFSGRATRIIARLNGLGGIIQNGNGGTATVDGCTAVDNGIQSAPGLGPPGISIQSGTIANSTVSRSAGNGVECNRCAVTGNLIERNDHGIDITGSGSATVRGNVVFGNTRFGLFNGVAGTGAAYAENTFEGNNGGGANPQVSGGIEIGVNVCQGDTVCP